MNLPHHFPILSTHLPALETEVASFLRLARLSAPSWFKMPGSISVISEKNINGLWLNLFIHIITTHSEGSKLWTFKGPFQDYISWYKVLNGKFHNAAVRNIHHTYM